MAVLVIRRIKAMGEAGEVGQDLVDLMFADLDLSLHERERRKQGGQEGENHGHSLSRPPQRLHRSLRQ